MLKVELRWRDISMDLLKNHHLYESDSLPCLAVDDVGNPTANWDDDALASSFDTLVTHTASRISVAAAQGKYQMPTISVS